MDSKTLKAMTKVWYFGVQLEDSTAFSNFLSNAVGRTFVVQAYTALTLLPHT